MSAKTTYLQNNVLNWLRGTAFPTAPTAIYAALYTAAPTDAGGGTEVSGGSYTRVAITFAAPSAGSGGQQISSSAACVFPTATANWGTVTTVGFFDASSAGNLLEWTALAASQVVNTGNQVQLASGGATLLEK